MGSGLDTTVNPVILRLTTKYTFSKEKGGDSLALLTPSKLGDWEIPYIWASLLTEKITTYDQLNKLYYDMLKKSSIMIIQLEDSVLKIGVP